MVRKKIIETAARGIASLRPGFSEALEKYGIEGKDISRLFGIIGSDKSLVGKEKTLYMRQLNRVLKNPDDFPEFMLDIQKRLGIGKKDFRAGGLAEILEV